jgi:2-polyprenyl-6-methoxyphenol hydroxylase-like FAD-dependent oxidoreductase
MSPIGGVGINLAIQDAVAAANVLAVPLKEGRVTPALLDAVQRRRTLPMRVIQWIQVQVQNNVLRAVLEGAKRPAPPFAVRLLNWMLQRIPARILGIGVRPEHVRTAEAAPEL